MIKSGQQLCVIYVCVREIVLGLSKFSAMVQDHSGMVIEWQVHDPG